MAERTQSVQVVREGETVTIIFQNGGWKASSLEVTTYGGIVAIAGIQDGIRVQAQVLNLRRD